MTLLTDLGLFATYNRTLNSRLYQLASELPTATLTEDKGAFFRSIRGTLNHLLVADLIWLNRFAQHHRFAQHPARFPALAALTAFPIPTALDQLLFDDFSQQRSRREELDGIIVAFVAQLTADDLMTDLHYRSTKGLPFTRNFGSVLLHFFNHQTHHRGQATTLFSQCGIDVGVTDFLAVIPNVPEPG